MIKVGVDEMTIVVILKDKSLLKSHYWEDLAERVISEIDETLLLDQIFGPKSENEQKKIAGYSNGYGFGNHPFYFRICYHHAYWKMGVAIKFSAQSLAYFCEKFSAQNGGEIEVYQILQLLNSEFDYQFQVRLSRIDFCADFIDEGLSVNDLNRELQAGSIHFEYSTGKNNTSQINFYTSNNVVDTIYVGSKKANITTFLRIYNKRKEQIEQHGIHFNEAVNCNDWVRMENSIRGDYAHDITKRMLEMGNRDDLVSLISACLLNKYSLIDSNGADHKMTTLLRLAAEDPSDYYYSGSKYQDFSLDESLDYLVEKSGLLPFLYKAKTFDPDAITLFTQYLAERLERYSPTWSVTHWMTVHGQYYRVHGIKDVFAKKKT